MPDASTTQSNSRIFDPNLYFLGPPDRVKTLEQPSDIIHHISSYDVGNGVTHLAVNNLKAKRRADRTVKVDRDSIVVSVDGAVKDGRAGFGAYFGKSSELNISSLAPEKKNQTKELALLLGTAECLKISYELLILGPSSSPDSTPSESGSRKTKKKVVIITDSVYLVKCMADWIFVWQNKGLQTTKGEMVGNHVEIKGLGEVCLEVERVGCEIRFWLVEEGGVEDARKLAEQVLADAKEEAG
ncbi:uncharacterized protein LY89DRAFT_690652 [Mollisia scopiformis]|uniref:RNase H type-1 domain-containing protein n=1 Tax=Mollisia scopiformis TaxID=149040 RepID=A0A132BA48_MOLSC|nr:uncharacterized protein LY89DRAFT_690652 [Mollisia scopiformis]KUJ09123.1 hypothetical protein LY89DRAFT_690652 [Mollisia scopiformis]